MKLLLLVFLISVSCMPQARDSNVNAAKVNVFITSLTEAQQEKTLFAFDDMNRYEWHYFPASMIPRTGIAVKDLNNNQKEKLYSFMQLFLSTEGYKKTKGIMELENVLRDMEPGNVSRISENYSVAIYGKPGTDSVWGWKFGGHHIALNFTVVSDTIAFAPFFFGANPATVGQGPLTGYRAMKQEEDLGFELVNTLTPEQKQKAFFELNIADIETGNAAKVDPLKPVGIIVSDMTHDQKLILNKLIAAYLFSMSTDLANARMKKIIAEDMDALRFAWVGSTKSGVGHYYRVQGKTFLIEFDNTQNNANHIHSVWRDFNGDFGRDLLKYHYEESHHNH